MARRRFRAGGAYVAHRNRYAPIRRGLVRGSLRDFARQVPKNSDSDLAAFRVFTA